MVLKKGVMHVSILKEEKKIENSFFSPAYDGNSCLLSKCRSQKYNKYKLYMKKYKEEH